MASKNKNVLAGESFVEGSRSRTGHYKRSYLPRIQADVGGEVGKTGVFDTTVEPYGDIETRVNVFRGGKDRLEEKALAVQVDLSDAEKRKTYLHELSRARLLFADALYYQEILKSLPKLSTAARQQLGMVQKQVAAGLAPESDRLGFEIFLNNLKAEQLLQEEDYEHARQEMKAVLGIPFDSELQLAGGAPTDFDAELLNSSLNPEENQDILMLKRRAEIAGIQKSQEDRWWTPALDVYGGFALYTFRQIQFSTIDERKSAFGGVNLSFQVFDGLEAKTRKRALEHQARGYALEAEQKRRELEALFEKLKHELVNRRKLMAIISQNVNLGVKS
ncbi:MAG TPA: TolC family protein, partial [bacterium]|nr:TolC family protein [bacterium]